VKQHRLWNWKKKVTLYEKSLAELHGLIDKYPQSQTAVKLASGQSIGNINREELESQLSNTRKTLDEKIKLAIREECYKNPTSHCVVALAVSSAKTIEYAGLRARALADISKAQAEAGNIKEALRTAITIEDADRRARALTQLYEILIKIEKHKSP
jgi:hypothetical protein